MRFRDYNDYEIIDLIKQGNEEALSLLVAKYTFLIAKKIKKFNLYREYDDCFQESLMILYKSAIRFTEHYNKSFTRYFENNLENALISILRKKKTYGKFLENNLHQLVEYEVDESRRVYYTENDIHRAIDEFSSFERQVFDCCFIRKLSVKQTAIERGCTVKKIYNAMDRIRHKLKIHLRG